MGLGMGDCGGTASAAGVAGAGGAPVAASGCGCGAGTADVLGGDTAVSGFEDGAGKDEDWEGAANLVGVGGSEVGEGRVIGAARPSSPADKSAGEVRCCGTTSLLSGCEGECGWPGEKKTEGGVVLRSGKGRTGASSVNTSWRVEE
jgi:hypothetical protein